MELSVEIISAVLPSGRSPMSLLPAAKFTNLPMLFSSTNLRIWAALGRGGRWCALIQPVPLVLRIMEYKVASSWFIGRSGYLGIRAFWSC